MKKNDLFLNQGILFRVLDNTDTQVFIFNCLKRTTPYWTNMEPTDDLKIVPEEQLLQATNTTFPNFSLIPPDKRKLIQEKYGTISLILPYVSNGPERNRAIELCAKTFEVSKATIRNRLYNYLAFQDIRIFLPNVKENSKELSVDEKNFRWALNKYYYNAIKLPLKETYRRLIKDRYCDDTGKVLPTAPTFRQFSYFYQKTVNQENLIISRDGKGNFLRNHRAMLGSGIRDFCPTLGYGMFDSTICDIFLVNDQGELVGRPVLTACVDGFSSMCLGYYVGFQGGVNSLKKLLNNICADKPDHCRKFGIEITQDQWNCNQLPHKFITDKGREYVSETFSQITDLGIEIINLPPYRPDLKSAVEKFFDIVQGYYKKDLASKGVIFEDYQERGGKDYRKNATFTIQEFEKILLLCIIKYNTSRIIDLPYECLDKVEPFSNSLWNYHLSQHKNNLIPVSKEQLELTLLPRTTGTFKRNGLIVHGLRYKNLKYTEQYLKGGTAIVAFNPNNVSKVWLFDKGNYDEFEIIESFFKDMDLENAQALQQKKSEIERSAEAAALQGSIDLSRELEVISKTHSTANPSIKHVRENRKVEKTKENYSE